MNLNKQNSGYTLVEIVVFLAILMLLTLLPIGIYIVFHLVSKYW